MANNPPDAAILELLSSPWLSANSREIWEPVIGYGQRKLYKKRAAIIQPGDTLQYLYYLRAGRVRMTASDSSGHQKTMWFISDGYIFGETPLFNLKPCAYSFMAETDCETYIFNRDTLLKNIIPHHPTIVLSLLNSMARKIHVLSTQVEDLVFFKPVNRVARLIFLMHQSKETSDGKKSYAPLPVTQEEIAEILGLHRVTINNAIKQLKHQGIIETNTHQIIIKDFDGLHDIGQQEA